MPTQPSDSALSSARNVSERPLWGIVCALNLECRALLAGLGENKRSVPCQHGRVWAGQFRQTAWRLFQCGLGGAAARQTLAAQLHEHPVECLLICGLSGGLDPSLKPGEVLEVQRVLSARSGTVRTCNFLSPETPVRLSPLLLTSASPLLNIVEKAVAREKTGAELVDMETFELLQLAEEQSLPVSVLRVIGDTAVQNVLPESLRFVQKNGEIHWSAVALFVAARPWKVPTLLKMQQESRLALQNLTTAVRRILSNA